jgi:hypothetical protein
MRARGENGKIFGLEGSGGGPAASVSLSSPLDPVVGAHRRPDGPVLPFNS